MQVIPGACGKCQKCYNESPYEEKDGKISQVMYCPAGAISKADEGIAIDREKCLGCLLCVRNCFRVQKSNDIALRVTQMPENPKNGVIPENNADMVRKRDENAPKLKWTRFRYDVG